MYRDNRAVEEARELRDRFGAQEMHRLTGHLPAAFHIAPKVMWLRRHRPDVFSRTAHFLQPRDLAVLALTGEYVTDGTHAAATLLFDLTARKWHRATFDSLDLDPALFPQVRGSWEIVGEVLPSVARRLGLTTAVPVILGGADSQACAFGAGVVVPGPVSEMAGSSTCLNTVVEHPLDDLAITHYTHVVPERFTTETGINTTGAAIGWLARLLYGGRRGRPSSADFLRLDAEAAAVEPGSDGVTAIAVLGDGDRTDPDLRGAFVGLSERHGRGILARAMLEGVALAIRSQLSLLEGAGVTVTELRVSGGDARLATWNQIKADVTGLVVRRVPGDAATAGVAMLAGLGAGVYADAQEAIARCVHPEAAIEPRVEAMLRYDEVYGLHTALVRSGLTHERARDTAAIAEDAGGADDARDADRRRFNHYPMTLRAAEIKACPSDVVTPHATSTTASAEEDGA
jgi:sugar (pentulose or hexulose) kinase